jgi:arsenite methyltransferase
MVQHTSSLEQVKAYYGQILTSNRDLQTNACCPTDSLPHHLRDKAAKVHPEILERFYGCGSPLPLALEGKTVLDLGCGTGRDCYILSQLVGPEGRVIGVDMTEEQLAVARRYQEYHRQQFALAHSNVSFLKGYIEDLESLGLASDSVDVVVSNCVINLSPDKRRVFSEIFRVLRPGGELYFSDVFASRRLPPEIAGDPVLLGECLGGALYKEDFRRLLAELGCRDFRLMSQSPITVQNAQLEAKLGVTRFDSLTIRAFKLDLEDRCEDYGQVARYRGGIVGANEAYALDDHHLFLKGRWQTVCSNTAAMLEKTRLASYFEVMGSLETHFGLFECTPSAAIPLPNATAAACC